MESESALPQTSTENLKFPSVIIQKELHSLIGTVKKMQIITTYEEVLDGLKMYVWENKLYDPHNPFKVCCKDDALSSIFGAEEFTVFDVKNILQKLVTPIYKISNDSPEATFQCVSNISSKRKLDENFELDNFESDQKKMCAINGSTQPASSYVLYIPPTPEKCDSSDSADSIQGYETACLKDASDKFSSAVDSDEFFSNEERIIAVEETFDLEYEVETDFSDEEGNLSSDSTDSEAEIAAEVALDAALLTFVCRTDSDIEFFADNSSEEDAEIPESDHWTCRKCNFSNRPPMRYCSKCWEERLEWFPENSKANELASPARKRRKSKKSRNSATCSSSQEISEKDEASLKSSQDSQGSSCPGVSSGTKESSLLTASAACSVGTSAPALKLCIICCDKPANASIIHSKYAHQICCYRCARKLQKQKKRCPICRRTIDRVVHQISDI